MENTASEVLVGLEEIQGRIGHVQKALIDMLKSLQAGAKTEAVKAALLKLEETQKNIGEIQTDIIRKFQSAAAEFPQTGLKAADEKRAPEVAHKQTAASTNFSGPAVDLKKWLAERGISIQGMRESSGLDEAADSAAAFLGKHFSSLRAFHDAIRRRIGGAQSGPFPCEGLPPQGINNIVSLGNMLHRCGFFSQFKYVRTPAKKVVFEPQNIGKVTNFFNGDWLERYSRSLVKESVVKAGGSFFDEQLLLGPKVVFPDMTEGELDLLLGLQDGRVIWLECKTGRWQDFVARYKNIQKNYLRLSQQHSALVLLDPLSDVEKNSASALSSMSVMHIEELPGWLDKAVAAIA